MLELIRLTAVIFYFVLVFIVFVFMMRHLFAWLLNSGSRPGKSGKSIEFFALFFDRYATEDGARHRDKWAIWMFLLIVIVFFGVMMDELLEWV
jgi:hypothetical protein